MSSTSEAISFQAPGAVILEGLLGEALDANRRGRLRKFIVEARAKLPQDGPKPTPDPNGMSQENPVTVDLKLGIGELTQSQEDRVHGRVRGLPAVRPAALARTVREAAAAALDDAAR